MRRIRILEPGVPTFQQGLGDAIRSTGDGKGETSMAAL